MAKSWQPNILGFSILQRLERCSLVGYGMKKRRATSLAGPARATWVVEMRAALAPRRASERG